jgi:hypothetical protein
MTTIITQNASLLLIKEINKTQYIGNVRTLGILKFYDASENTATIEDEGYVLQIDTSLLPQFYAKINTWYTFIGEIQQQNNSLQVKIAKVMDGMDSNSIKLWKQSLTVRETYLKQFK